MAIDIPILNETIKAIDTLIVKIGALDKTMNDATQHFIDNGKKMKDAMTPTAVNNNSDAIDALTRKIKEQDAAIQKLIGDIDKLRNARKQGNQLSAQEAVNQGILNKQALEAARINSTLAGAYLKLNAQHAKAARLLQDLIVRGRQAGQTQREYNREISNAKKEFEELNKRILIADRAVGKFNRNVGNYPKQAFQGIKDLLGAFGIVGGVQMFASIVKDIFATTKEIQSLDMALRQVVQTNALFAESQAFLSRISEAYGVNINDLTKQFTQFYVSAKDKISGREIEQIFESITKAGAAMGLSQQQQERAFMALNQMMSKGTIQAEELRGQLGEALPGALGIMAKSLGVSEKKLGEMMKAGQLLAADVLPKFAEQLEKTYGIEQVKRIETLTATQNRLSNSWIEFVRTLNESESGGVTQFFSSILQGANWLLQGLVQINQSLEQIRNKFVNETTISQAEYLNSIKDINEREKLSILTKKDAIVEITKLNEQLLQLNHEFALLDEVKPLNFLPSRIARLKEVEREIEQVNASLGTQKGRLLGAQQVIDQINEKQKKTDPSELTKAQLKAIEDALKAKYEMAKKEIELEILKQETILSGETNTFKEQYAALKRYNELKIQLIILDYNEHVRLAKGNADKIRSAELDMQMAMIKNENDFHGKIKTIRKKENDEYIQELKDVEAFLKEHYEKEQSIKEEAEDLDVKIFNAKMARWKAEQDRLEELRNATKDYLESFTGEAFSNAGLSQTFDNFFKQIEGVDGKMTTMFQQLLEGAQTSKEKFAVYFTSIAESAQEAFNFISQMSQKNFDGEKERLQSQYDVAVKFANGNKEAEEKLAEDLEKKKAEIATREAKAKKKQALMNIAIDTAQAIIGLWAKPGFPAAIPLIAVVAGLGLAQAAIVNAQEIPQYWMGGTHDGGLMMVNDGKGSNYKETIVTPDGKIMKPQGRNVIMDAPAGTEIYTPSQWNEKLAEMLQGKGIDMAPASNNSYGISKNDIREAMLESIGEQPQYHTNITEDGITKLLVKRGNVTKIMSQRGNSTKQVFKR